MNSIMVICPYLDNGTWVFDDPSVGLRKEAFVAGAPEILEALVAREKIENPQKGFRLFFSATPFPTQHLEVKHLKEEMGGNWYTDPEGRAGWLCPALFKYFETAPKSLYLRVENLLQAEPK
jgi:hypothetical protein